MAGSIRISPDVMNQRAGQYRNEAQNIGQVISSMDGLVSNLQAEWEGEASNAFVERYQSDLKPSFQRAQQLIEEIAAALDSTANDMRETDHIQRGKWL